MDRNHTAYNHRVISPSPELGGAEITRQLCKDQQKNVNSTNFTPRPSVKFNLVILSLESRYCHKFYTLGVAEFRHRITALLCAPLLASCRASLSILPPSKQLKRE